MFKTCNESDSIDCQVLDLLCMTYEMGFGLDDLGLLTHYSHNSGLQTLQRYRYRFTSRIQATDL
jgi:hypothetical protein